MLYDAFLSTIFSKDGWFQGITGGTALGGLTGFIEAYGSLLVVLILGIVKYVFEYRKLKAQKAQKAHIEQMNEIEINKATIDIKLREIELEIATKQLNIGKDSKDG